MKTTNLKIFVENGKPKYLSEAFVQSIEKIGKTSSKRLVKFSRIKQDSVKK